MTVRQNTDTSPSVGVIELENFILQEIVVEV